MASNLHRVFDTNPHALLLLSSHSSSATCIQKKEGAGPTSSNWVETRILNACVIMRDIMGLGGSRGGMGESGTLFSQLEVIH